MLLRTRTRHRRRGAVVVEYALVLSATLALTCGLVVVGVGFFRYQQMALLAREGARYASVHAAQYQQVTGGTAADAAAVYNNAITPLATGLDLSKLSYTVNWDDPSKGPVYLSNPATNTYRINYVTVTVRYNWLPQMYLGATTLSSQSRMPLTF
jgi:Flp pilus assembly protein TadG